MRRPGSGRRLEGWRVLLVEDEPMVAMDFASALTAEGAILRGPVVTLAKAEAMLADRNKPLDLAFVDLRLGDQSALPLVERLSRLAIPTILITGYEAGEVLAHESWHMPRLVKPVMPGQLIDAALHLLAQAKPERSAEPAAYG